jgi:restriction endonuclease S subunit/predicted GIY-YIG superfamily endonuclease
MIRDGWEVVPLEAISENFDALRVPVRETDRRPGPYPYYGATGIVDYVDSHIFDGEYTLVAEDGENLRTRKAPVTYFVRGKFWVNNHAHILRGNARADTKFLYYALSLADINGYLTGSTMPKLTQASMNRIRILAPPLAEQRAIAHILGTLDDKIELNRRMNETLEGMARAIFKSWFVDFDPVRAKLALSKAEGAEGRLPAPRPDTFYVYVIECEGGSHYIGQTDDLERRWNDHRQGKVEWTRRHKPVRIAHYEEFSTRGEAVKRESNLKTGFGRKWLKKLIASGRARQAGQPSGMDAETAALFPDSFLDSPLGKIPKGWSVSSLGEVIELAYGKALKEDSRCPGAVPVYGSNGQVGWHNEALVKGPGVVVGRKGNPGTVTWVHTDFCAIDTTFYVAPKDKIRSMSYLFHALSLLGLPSLGADSAVPGLNRNIAYISEILVPSAEAVKAFDNQSAPLLARVHANESESITLAAIRDALLPKLLSGEIRVKEAEKFLETHAQ